MKPWKDWTIGDRQELLGEIFTRLTWIVLLVAFCLACWAVLR